MDKRRKLEELYNRMGNFDELDLVWVERAIRQREPAGKKAFTRYMELKKLIRRETNKAKKEELITEALRLGREYDL